MAQINKPTEYFNTALYTGNSSTQSVTGVGFQPDLVWTKARNIDYAHSLFDVVRGATKRLVSSGADAESTISGVTSFDSDGFTLGSNANCNESTRTYVGWNWLAGGTASSNTDGTITSSVSASTTSGFSIVSYTGTGTASDTVGHGLGVTPSMVIIKTRNTATYNWYVKHKSLASNNNLFLNLSNSTTDVSSQSQGGIGNLDNSSTFSFANGTAGIESVNKSSDTYIAYCFAEKKGFSKFGSYTGNGSADGTFVYTGFKPAFVLLKNTDAVEQWWIFDNKRNAYTGNFIYYALNPNGSSTENTTLGDNNHIDFLSNGFKLRTTAGQLNGSGNSLIYMAIAEQPLTGTNGIPCTAR